MTTNEDPKTEMVDVEVQDTTTAVDEQAEKFEPERAMELIRKQREENKALKKAALELEKYKQREEERKKAEMTELERLKAEYDQAQAELKASR